MVLRRSGCIVLGRLLSLILLRPRCIKEVLLLEGLGLLVGRLGEVQRRLRELLPGVLPLGSLLARVVRSR
jgi:hypothetical protein